MDVEENEQSLPNLYRIEFIVPTYALNWLYVAIPGYFSRVSERIPLSF